MCSSDLTNFKEYSQRLFYYEEPKFICEITGQTDLTFIEANDSEDKQLKELQNIPDSIVSEFTSYLKKCNSKDVKKISRDFLKYLNSTFYLGESVYLKKGSNNLSGSFEVDYNKL